MHYFVLQRRFSEQTALWSVTNTSPGFFPMIQRGHSIPAAFKLAAVDDLRRDKEAMEFELLDFNGNGNGALISSNFKNCIEKLNPKNVQILPISLNFMQTDADWFLLHPIKVYGGLIDMKRSHAKRINLEGELIIPSKVHLCSKKMQTLDPQEQVVFTLAEIPEILVINEICAHALEAAHLSGFKAIPLEAWHESLCYDDPYLAPHHHPHHPDNLHSQ